MSISNQLFRSTLGDYMNKILLILLIGGLSSILQAETAEVSLNLYNLDKENWERRDLDSYTLDKLGHSIQVVGTAIDYKGSLSFLFVTKVIYYDQKNAGTGIADSKQFVTKDVRALVILRELAAWPPEYAGKELRLSGYLNIHSEDIIQNYQDISKRGSALKQYAPFAPYYFTKYSWSLVGEHHKSVQSTPLR